MYVGMCVCTHAYVETERYRERDTQIQSKEWAHTVVGASWSKICRVGKRLETEGRVGVVA